MTSFFQMCRTTVQVLHGKNMPIIGEISIKLEPFANGILQSVLKVRSKLIVRHRENFWAFTGPRIDCGLILLISNMIIRRSFTGPTQLLSAHVRGPVSFAVSALWPSDTIWRHGSVSTLAQVMACCLTTSSHYLNQC